MGREVGGTGSKEERSHGKKTSPIPYPPPHSSPTSCPASLNKIGPPRSTLP